MLRSSIIIVVWYENNKGGKWGRWVRRRDALVRWLVDTYLGLGWALLFCMVGTHICPTTDGTFDQSSRWFGATRQFRVEHLQPTNGGACPEASSPAESQLETLPDAWHCDGTVLSLVVPRIERTN